MSDDFRSLKKKIKKKARKTRKQAKYRPRGQVYAIGGGLVIAGLALARLGVTLNGSAQSILLTAGIVLLVLGGGVCLLQALPGLWPAAKVLHFTEDSVQLLNSQNKLVGEIPFSNVATAELTYVEDGVGNSFQAVAVMLYKPKDLGTWWPHGLRNSDYDIVILDHYNRPMTAILREIREGVERYLQKKTGRIRDEGI
jgi:hypothetical protein